MADGAITRHEFECELNRLRDIADERDRRYEGVAKSAQQALEVSVKSQAEYRAQQNEWRGLIADVASKKIDRADYELRNKDFERQMAELREAKSGFTGTLLAIYAVIGIVSAAILAGVVSYIVSRMTGHAP